MFNQSEVHGTDVEYADLKKHLRVKTVEELKNDIGLIFEEEASSGIPVDPELMAAYAEIIMELEPCSVSFEDINRSEAIFKQRHPELFNSKPTKRRPRRGHISWSKLAVATMLLLVLTGLGGMAIATYYPQFLPSWSLELFGIDAVPEDWGNSTLTSPSESGYYSLEEALSAYNVDAAIPAHILSGYSIDDVYVSEKPNWTSFTAIYKNAEEKTFVLRVICYPTEHDVPSLKLEKDASDTGETYKHNKIDFLISSNLGRVETLWNYGTCASRLSGDLSVEQVKTMINTINKES